MPQCSELTYYIKLPDTRLNTISKYRERWILYISAVSCRLVCTRNTFCCSSHIILYPFLQYILCPQHTPSILLWIEVPQQSYHHAPRPGCILIISGYAALLTCTLSFALLSPGLGDLTLSPRATRRLRAGYTVHAIVTRFCNKWVAAHFQDSTRGWEAVTHG